MTAPPRQQRAHPQGGGGLNNVWIKIFVVYALVMSIVAIFQTGRLASLRVDMEREIHAVTAKTASSTAAATMLTASSLGNNNHDKNQTTTITSGWDPYNPMGIPRGQAPNLPSIRVEQEDDTQNVDGARKYYGGVGDKQHLGGFTEIDMHGISPMVWKHMVQKYGVHSLLDVGCGRGISTLWFETHGADVLCVEGSHDAVHKTMLPDPATQIVEHDFSRGPWWPLKTYDAVWSVEFLEHVNVHNQFNYLTAFRKAALLFVTSSRWDGWHHTEVHFDEWWIQKYEAYGFRYSPELTSEVRAIAGVERDKRITGPTGEGQYNAQHIWLTMKVFVNPVVAALPQHAHLFFELGCYDGKTKGTRPQMKGRKCGSGKNGGHETPLAPEYFPLKLTAEMDRDWERQVRDKIKSTAETPPLAYGK